MEQDDKRAAIAALRTGLELGLTHIDTAELYGSGSVEELVAEVLTESPRTRAELHLVSKVMPSHASRLGTVRACEQSLKRLRTDYLDCYLLHWPGDEPLEDTIAGFEQLRETGKIRAWGVSNFDEGELEEAWSFAGPGKIACNQVLYHLKQRDIEHAVVPWCQAHDVAVVGYTPFGRSSFPPVSKADKAGKTLENIAKSRGATARQVALAFLTREAHLFAIPKASNASHVRENAAALALTLNLAELEAIDAAYPRPPRRRGVPML